MLGDAGQCAHRAGSHRSHASASSQGLTAAVARDFSRSMIVATSMAQLQLQVKTVPSSRNSAMYMIHEVPVCAYGCVTGPASSGRSKGMPMLCGRITDEAAILLVVGAAAADRMHVCREACSQMISRNCHPVCTPRRNRCSRSERRSSKTDLPPHAAVSGVNCNNTEPV